MGLTELTRAIDPPRYAVLCSGQHGIIALPPPENVYVDDYRVNASKYCNVEKH